MKRARPKCTQSYWALQCARGIMSFTTDSLIPRNRTLQKGIRLYVFDFLSAHEM